MTNILSGSKSLWGLFFSTAVLLLTVPPAPAETVSPYGICAHVSRHGDHELAVQEFQLMRQAGIRWARTDFDWTTVQPTKDGPWDYSMLDRTVEMAQESGISILPILAYDVSWASPAYKHLDAWLEYVRRTVSRYQDRLGCWEVWNEPDLEQFWKEKADPANYTILLKATCQEIKKINPNLKVLLGGVSGIPFEYIEGIYKAGGQPYFDIMAVHPYRYPASPEDNSLLSDLDRLRALMTQYGDADKPIWMTEIGWPTHQNLNPIVEDVVRAGLKAVAPQRTNWTLAVFEDPQYPVQISLSDERLLRMLPGGGRILRLTLDQMQSLDPAIHHALLPPPEEGFCGELFDTIERYVRQGGTLILTQGVPLYYIVSRDDTGNWTRRGADESYRQRLHIGWEAWWTRPGVSKSISSLTVPAAFADQIDLSANKTPAERFLTSTKLHDGDRFIPLIQAAQGDYTGTAAALLELDSDLKGAVIVSTLMQDFRGVTEIRQALMLARATLIALHSGAECMFWYNLRARENDPQYNEDHFGIIHRDLSPKPAYRAMQTLAQARPVGSMPSGEQWHNDTFYYPHWKRPDGLTGYALWRSSGTERLDIRYEGKIQQAFDVLGEPITIPDNNGWATLSVSEQPIYLIGSFKIVW